MTMKKKLLFITGWLLITILPVSLFAQNKTVTGQVIGENNLPISGATIIVKGDPVYVSDVNGRFTLVLPQNAILIITAVGYKAQTIKVGNSSDLVIKLSEDVARLEEIVVTGITTSVKRRNLANAVATISSKELNGISPAQTLDAALEGKISGAYINANSGAPGGGISVKLRGVTSVYGNTQPLYVIDGVYVDNTSTSGGLNVVTAALANKATTSNQDNPSSRIADLRPEDIENIEILKGASAAAIYGTRAANGVIIITTKKGVGGKLRVNFSSTNSVSVVTKKVDVLSADQFRSIVNAKATAAQKAMLGSANTDWQNQIYPGDL